MKSKRFRTILLWAFTALWAGLIFYFSAQNGEASAAASEEFMGPFARILTALLGEAGHTFVRKCAHFFLYAMLMVFAMCAYRSGGGKRPFAAPFILCVLYAVSDEIHQYFVPGRACRVYDIGVDALGCIAGALCLRLLCVLVDRIRAGKESREKT